MFSDPRIASVLLAAQRAPVTGDWTAVMAAICALTGADGARLGPHGAGRHLPSALTALTARLRLRAARVYDLDELLDPATPATLKAMRRDLMRAGVASLRVMALSARVGDPLILWRRTGEFGAADAARLTALAPFLEQAQHLHHALCAERSEAMLTARAAAAVPVHGYGLSSGGRLFAPPGGLRRAALVRAGLRPWPDGRLEPERADLRAVWQAALALAMQGESAVITLRSGARARLTPQTDGTLTLFLRDGVPPPDAALLARELGIPRAEARVAAALCQGHSLAEAATALGLTLETVRNYSRRIYAMTGLRGQADLVRACLSGVACLTPPPPDAGSDRHPRGMDHPREDPPGSV